jgi:membrane fusion protein (multidrug efflux system)
MVKRMILMLVVTLTLIGTLGFVKFRQVQEAIAHNAAFTTPPEAVTTITAKSETWPATLNVIGTAAAVQGVTVSADLPGIVSRIAFESGASVQEGDILVQLDTKQEQAQLAAVEATRDLARLNFERFNSLVDEGAITRAEYDRAAAEQKETAAKVEEIRAMIERKNDPVPLLGNPWPAPSQPRAIPVSR